MQKLSFTQKVAAVLEMVKGCTTPDSLQAIGDVVELYIKTNSNGLNSLKEIDQAVEKITQAVAARAQFITKMPIIDTDGTITHTESPTP